MKNTEMNIKKETPIDGGTITLQKPIEINGKAVSELPYDINEINVVVHVFLLFST